MRLVRPDRSCTVCGESWTDPARFCGRCGARLEGNPRTTPPWPSSMRSLAIAAVAALASVAAAVVLVLPDTAPTPPTSPEEVSGAVSLPRPPPRPETGSAVSDCGTGSTSACVLWSTDVGSPESFPSFVAEEGTLYVRSGQEQLTALGMGNGEVVWRIKTPGRWHPLDVGAAVLLTRSIDGTLGGVSLYDGRILWRRPPTGAAVAGRPAVVAPPWVFAREGVLVVAFGAVTGNEIWSRTLRDGETALLRPFGAYLATEDALTSLSGNTGRPRWTLPLTAPLAALGGTAKTVAVLDAAGGVRVVRTWDGQTIWHDPNVLDDPGAVRLRVLPEQGLLVVSSRQGHNRSEVVALELADGRRRWRAQLGSAVFLSDQVAAGALLVLVPWLEDPTEVAALDLDTGARRWGRPLPAATRVAVVDDSEVAVSSPTGLLGLDARTGAVLWRAEVGSSELVSGAPLVAVRRGSVLSIAPPD